MNELIIATSLCDRCGREIPPAWDDCPLCAALPAEAPSSSVPAPARLTPAHTLSAALARRWVVISALLVVGPVGLPLLWLSPRFSGLAKILFTVGVMFVAVVLPIVLVWYFCNVLMRPLVESFSM